MNRFLNEMEKRENTTYTENGDVAYKTTYSGLVDLFALGGSYRNRTDADCIILFEEAFAEDESLAMKCLFYLRDIRGGQGERRFFRVVMHWLAENYPLAAKRNMEYIADFGRWDDLVYSFLNTPLESVMIKMIKEQLAEDIKSEYPSLCAKWLPSANASSLETKSVAKIIQRRLGMTAKQYRKTLSSLRKKIKIVESLMSQKNWDEIDFSKIPSRAGFLYSNAFLRREETSERYMKFIKNKNTKVNAGTLYPYECVHKALDLLWRRENEEKINVVNKYWDNLKDYINNAKFNGIAVVDTSGSMSGRPIEVALSLGLYCAEKNKGVFKDKFITFSDHPQIVKLKGNTFFEKVTNMNKANWGWNTDIKKVYNLLLDMAVESKCSQEEIPQNLIIISDMQFDGCTWGVPTLDSAKQKWKDYGYTMPHLTFWNVDARQDSFPTLLSEDITLVSGFSPVLFEQVMQNKDTIELVFEKLNEDRYKNIF